MRRQLQILVFIAVIFSALFLPVEWVVSSASGVGTSPTVPPSSQLVRSANPVDTSSNLIVTGNVSGGKHFRGVVPYQSTSNFRGISSSPVESFLRYSAGSGNYKSSVGGYKPYYSYTRTVTATRPVYSRVFSPPVMGIGGGSSASKITGLGLKKGLLSEQDIASVAPGEIKGTLESVSEVGLGAVQTQRSVFGISRPMSMTMRQLQESAEKQISVYERKGQIEQFRQDLNRISEQAVNLDQGLINKIEQDSSELALELSRGTQPESPQTRSQMQPKSVDLLGDEQLLETGTDIYELMKQQIAELQKELDTLRAESGQPDKKVEDKGEKPSDKQSKQVTKSFLLEGLSDAEISLKAKSILGEHKTFASYSEDTFNQYIRAGEEYLKQGKFYRAADSYTLASIYKPGDPLAYVGKSHALFGAGEYMSSALFLSRALEIFPEYARFKVNIETMLGDKDKLENRIADVQQWLESSKAPELQFLLGYVYYQMNRLHFAKLAIYAADEQMPTSPAVDILKTVIDEEIKRSK